MKLTLHDHDTGSTLEQDVSDEQEAQAAAQVFAAALKTLVEGYTPKDIGWRRER